ncbi:MAG TPA: DUF1634 domain-containing protein [Gemmatimonadaceae bacterium]|nr:DUF1634 domain-containing protein [Gemmatimonadaceae bacterium]
MVSPERSDGTAAVRASGHAADEERVEQMVGNLLRTGVLIAALVAFAGGVAFLAHHGASVPAYHVFRGEPTMLNTLGGVLHGVAAFDTAAIVQFGIVLLIATPVARVLLTLIAFAMRRDWMYVVISAIVLGALMFSLLGG